MASRNGTSRFSPCLQRSTISTYFLLLRTPISSTATGSLRLADQSCHADLRARDCTRRGRVSPSSGQGCDMNRKIGALLKQASRLHVAQLLLLVYQ